MDNQQLPGAFPQYQDDEITLKELILKIKEYYLECKRNWKTILLFVLPFVGYQLFLRFTKPPVYPATLTFMVNDSKGSSIGGMLGQFRGLIGDEENKLDKILELAKSRKTTAAALFKKETINGKYDFLANHLIRIQGIHSDWQKNKMLKDFLFTRSDIDSFNTVENRALRNLHSLLIGNEKIKPIYITNSKKKSGIMLLNLTSNSEELSVYLVRSLFESLSNFYVESTIRKEKESWEVLVAKKDSIEKILNVNDISTARHEDQSNNLLFQFDKVPAKQYARKNAVLSTLYAEVIRNTELAEFALKTATPYITSIDEPIPPIAPLYSGNLVSLIKFIVFGVVFGVLFVVLRKLFRDVMAS